MDQMVHSVSKHLAITPSRRHRHRTHAVKDRDIKNGKTQAFTYVKQHKSCEKYAPRNKKHEDIPKLPYERVSADILAFGGNNFLIITDACSKWVGTVLLQGKNVESVIDACKACMVTHKYWSQIIFHSIPGNIRILQRIDLNFSSAAQDMRKAMAWRKKVCTLPNSFYENVGKQILTIGRLCDNMVTLLHQGLEQWYNRTSDRKYIAFKSGQNVVERTSHDKYRKPVVILVKHKMPRSYSDLIPSYNHHAPVKNYSDLATVSGEINMKVEGDRDSSEKTISTMQDAVERETEVLIEDKEN
ncbi:hypothetical protein PR048_025782 [Dryococelus australis]|uniref:Integrase catalytic domain-containing protein n=1 Tax=Dryococelus australis TaxID=614101 RepID=A0ABQ9GJI3_9NEOP|nr:hypothetical protein PR048_025782 [Dryococelus australis]